MLQTEQMVKWLRRAVLVAVVLVLALQVLPYGRDHTNPPVTRAIRWDRPLTEELAAGACLDCHSNVTDWKWYANVAPYSWLIQRDVEQGRSRLNFSEWDRPQPPSAVIVAAVADGSMPPVQYKPLHAGARLSDAQRNELVRGLRRTLSQDPPLGAGGDG